MSHQELPALESFCPRSLFSFFTEHGEMQHCPGNAGIMGLIEGWEVR